MSYGYGDDCQGARDAQRAADDAKRAADDVRHDVVMLADTVGRNRVNVESRVSEAESRAHELFEMIDALRYQVIKLEQRLQAVEGR